MQKYQIHVAGLCYVILCLVSNTALLNAGTCVSGQQSGTWTLAGSPYIISNARVSVPAGSTLVIEPGVVVMLKNGNNFTAGIGVQGVLIARGVTFTGADKIFRNPDDPNQCAATERAVPGTWGGINFGDSDTGSLIENCRILYGGTGNGSITQTANNNDNTSVTIRGTLIAYGAANGIWMNSGASPTIENCTIRDHAGSGIFHNSSNCNSAVTGCAILNNGNFAVQAFARNVKNYHHDFMFGNTPDAFRVVGGFVTTGTWEDHGVPYHVAPTISSDNVTVSDSHTLTLEAGVEIKFGRQRGFTVFGSMVADGDSCRRITFTGLDTSNTSNFWSGIFLNGSDAGTVLDFCDVRFVGGQNSEAIAISESEKNVRISNSRITHNDGIGIEVGRGSQPFIFNNLVAHNATQGMDLVSSARPVLRNNLFQGNFQGIRFRTAGSSADLGTPSDAGHNAFVDNTDWALLSNASDTVWAIGNFWTATDSAEIDTAFISDDDEKAGVGPVLFSPFDLTDLSSAPQPFPCPPACEALAVTITQPTAEPRFESTARFLTLGGTVTDDQGVLKMTWTNTTTGASGRIALAAPRSHFTWQAAQIPLIPGENIITVRAEDQDGCTATDDLIAHFNNALGSCWMLDEFDNLALGSLDGQNAWFVQPGAEAAQVISDPTDSTGRGKVIKLDPSPVQHINMGRTIVPQSDSVHTLEFLVRVEPSDTSMAKVEVNTVGNPKWDKKFQLYFGTTMRLNFGPTQPEAVNFISQVERNRWYHVKAVIDLEKEVVDIFVDNELKLDSIAINPGPISLISVIGWDSPGFVLFDDFRGCEFSPITHVASNAANELPLQFALMPNYPNPFNPSTTIRFELPLKAEVKITVYDLIGRKVAILVEAEYAAGEHSVFWDGRDQHGRTVGSGVYFVKMQAGRFVQTNKMALVR
ncbi:MAG: right-handed parallel beta-helix repeat-containing protein [bacterium]